MFPCRALVCLLFVASAVKAAEPNLLPTDSRRWSQAAQAALITDLSQASPATALTKGRREKGRWKTIPFAAAGMEGWALSTYSFTGAPVVKLPLPQRGWHAVYLGISTVSTGFKEARNGLQARLSDEPAYRRMANNLALIMPSRIDVIQEQFVTIAELTGQTLELTPLPNLPATICYAKLVPLTAEEVSGWKAERANLQRPSRNNIATFDGHSWIWPYEPKTAEDLVATFRGFEDSDIGKWWFQVLGADLVNYPSKVGNVPGEGTVDFPTREHAEFAHAIPRLHAKGINPLKIARDAARAQGVEFHVMLRPAGWKACIPYEETFNSKFYEAHPEWRCVDRDGTPTMHMSYAVPEVRRHLLEIFRETLALQPEGVGFLFNRGMPMILWEEAFCARFRELHQAEAREVPEDDPRILATRADLMTTFLREIRALLDETARAQGRTERYRISLATFSKEADNQKFGFDLPLWIREGLVDELAVAWFAHHTSFTQPDMAYYQRITAGSKVGVYPFVISWKPGKPEELCKRITAFYKEGAKGIAVWDPTVEAGYAGVPQHGNVFDVMSRVGQRALIERWGKEGVPLPLSIPLKRLDENHYSRWFPTTGF